MGAYPVCVRLQDGVHRDSRFRPCGRSLATYQAVRGQGDLVVAEVHAEREATLLVQQATNAFLPVTFEDIGQATAPDPTLTAILQYVLRGWPPANSRIEDREVANFYKSKESLSEINSCLIYRDRTVIPTSQRKTVLKQLHSGHPGIVPMKALAKYYCYLPGIDGDIETSFVSATSTHGLPKRL